ncbi:nitroreductase family deazaflavin-dependent oxidoreductase [Amycolatopsis pithecellobii]|uniref:Nitroreductase family deazaflavin-dependent oxidoreductase n=1 Tax=Amycolatopsis pithecellobii TaxID=664692 RepID=A0A6N7Z9F5_9PSEU|nr:nitroreductase family deazaflavin-dependent oxidoreductase [Amycolatopsis pithecellobii]MTD58359.1 nitroreductase family deazaflavin-dependent oxidoreductase [Amycolatopsis pithecellobii]
MATETVYIPWHRVREHTARMRETGSTEGVEVLGSPVVLLTLRGAKTGRLYYKPVMRVEDNGSYAVVASKRGASEHPTWYFSIKADPEVSLLDGTETKLCVAREVGGAERAAWWERAVKAFPSYAEYQAKTDRRFPILVLESK